ncbi:MAG: hypothetical protein JWR51_1222 [Devosia sp.]|uniref:DUF3768 domain-containing protein n=1 Tax=Devosia sp. TaxID=1871048 RepID=UPI0026112FD0|nr:DUF3768 domain-containing protein [Devosia sp.]MDB5528119.1 hypothetical protein [Devosia sp.]
MLTPGVANLTDGQRDQILTAVADFSDFSERNDPYGEHDCAIVDIDGLQVLWKIDYYDLSRLAHSPNPADPDVTCRVLTIMLADEY